MQIYDVRVLSMCACMHACVRVGHKSISTVCFQDPFILVLETGSLTKELNEHIRLNSYQAQGIYLPVSLSQLLELQAWATKGSFNYMGALVEVRYSHLSVKHFTLQLNISFSPNKHIRRKREKGMFHCVYQLVLCVSLTS